MCPKTSKQAKYKALNLEIETHFESAIQLNLQQLKSNANQFMLRNLPPKFAASSYFSCSFSFSSRNLQLFL